MRNINPTHKPIINFYAELKQYENLGATNETEVRLAFATLLQHYARQNNLTLVFACLFLIALLCVGCGADTDTEVPRILQTRVTEIRETSYPRRIEVVGEVIFSETPVNLSVTDETFMELDRLIDWEQYGEKVVLYFSTSKFVCTSTSPEPIPCPPEVVQEIGENPEGVLEKTFKCLFVWNTGRQYVSLKVVLTLEQAVYTPPN